MFPKDTKIDVEALIGNWMTLGYLGSKIDDMELKGRECFEILAMRSMFQDFEIDDAMSMKITSCMMHDIVHDFAQFVRKSGRMEDIRMNKKVCQVCDPLFVSNVNQFCSLDLNYKESYIPLCDCLTRLRVLSMNTCYLQSIPQGMNNLRWLNLSGNKLSHEYLSHFSALLLANT